MREPKDQNANVNVNQEASDLRTQKFIIPTQMVFGQILIKHFASFFSLNVFILCGARNFARFCILNYDCKHPMTINTIVSGK